MEVLYITIGVTIIIAGIFLYIFLHSVKTGQYEDTYTPSVRMLFDDELVSPKRKKEDDQKNINNTKNT
jgi:cbb3-type cytochrome oxidase maturation protein